MIAVVAVVNVVAVVIPQPPRPRRRPALVSYSKQSGQRSTQQLRTLHHSEKTACPRVNFEEFVSDERYPLDEKLPVTKNPREDSGSAASHGWDARVSHGHHGYHGGGAAAVRCALYPW